MRSYLEILSRRGVAVAVIVCTFLLGEMATAIGQVVIRGIHDNVDRLVHAIEDEDECDLETRAGIRRDADAMLASLGKVSSEATRSGYKEGVDAAARSIAEIKRALATYELYCGGQQRTNAISDRFLRRWQGAMLTVQGGIGWGNGEYIVRNGVANSGANASGASLGADFRYMQALAQVAWVAGMTSQVFFDYDGSLSQLNVLDTRIRLARDGFLLFYVGLAWTSPTISAWLAGIADQPGSGTALTTLYAGPRYDWLSGSVEFNGNTQHFSKNQIGWTVGLDVDYPLWFAGFERVFAEGKGPKIRVGVALDAFPGMTVDCFGTPVRVRSGVAGRVHVGLTIPFEPARF